MGGIGAMLYEGKAKKIFATARPDQVVQYFKDDATAFNAQKRGTIVREGHHQQQDFGAALPAPGAGRNSDALYRAIERP